MADDRCFTVLKYVKISGIICLFSWYADNDPKRQLVEYRMCVHVFGNSPSPAMATYGLWKTAGNVEQEFGSDVLSDVLSMLMMDLFPYLC